MEKLLISITSIFINIVNIALSYYCIGFVLQHWDLYYLVADFYTIKAYFAFNFIIGIATTSKNATIAFLEKEVKSKVDIYRTIKKGALSTLSILIIFLFSFILSLLF